MNYGKNVYLIFFNVINDSVWTEEYFSNLICIVFWCLAT